MVAKRFSFVIDTTFLLEDAEGAFLGAGPIADSQGQNNSVVYSAVRNMLRLRVVLGITEGIVVIGEETRFVTPGLNIERFRECLLALGTHVLHEPNIRVGALCHSILHDQREQWIVTRNKSLMQLIGAQCGIIACQKRR